jgi:hypothetical protein
MQAVAVAAFKIAKLLAQAVQVAVGMAQIMIRQRHQERLTQVVVAVAVGMLRQVVTAVQAAQA